MAFSVAFRVEITSQALADADAAAAYIASNRTCLWRRSHPACSTPQQASGYHKLQKREGQALMTITLDLNPEIESRAAAQAAARGLSLEAYIQSVLEHTVPTTPPASLSLEGFNAGLTALSEGGEALPVLSEEATSRAGIYGDHD